jgi:hypothetical protein
VPSGVAHAIAELHEGLSGAEDTILLDGFTAADVDVAPESGGTVLILGQRGRIRLPAVARIDDDDLAFR